MKRVFLDANVLIDYISARTAKYDAIWSTAVVDYCYKRSISLIVSMHSIMILSHFLEKEIQNTTFLRMKLEGVAATFEIVIIEKPDIEIALRSVMSDFEDAVQLSCALKSKADLLITRNVEDFYGTNLPIILPDQFFDFV